MNNNGWDRVMKKRKEKKSDSEKGIKIVLSWPKNKIRKTVISACQGLFVKNVFWVK